MPAGRLWLTIRRPGLPGRRLGLLLRRLGLPGRRLGLAGRRYGGIPVVILVAAGSTLGGLTVGWFLLSFLVAHNDAVTAVRESIGVSLGLLVLTSMIGAVRGAGRHPHRGE